MNKEKTIIINGVRYYCSRPLECKVCFFWQNQIIGCSLGEEHCYYLAESPKRKSPCEGCCYSPCISFCMKKVLGYPPEEVPACVR